MSPETRKESGRNRFGIAVGIIRGLGGSEDGGVSPFRGPPTPDQTPGLNRDEVEGTDATRPSTAPRDSGSILHPWPAERSQGRIISPSRPFRNPCHVTTYGAVGT